MRPKDAHCLCRGTATLDGFHRVRRPRIRFEVRLVLQLRPQHQIEDVRESDRFPSRRVRPPSNRGVKPRAGIVHQRLDERDRLMRGNVGGCVEELAEVRDQLRPMLDAQSAELEDSPGVTLAAAAHPLNRSDAMRIDSDSTASRGDFQPVRNRRTGPRSHCTRDANTSRNPAACSFGDSSASSDSGSMSSMENPGR
jgi:hypothetical protein